MTGGNLILHELWSVGSPTSVRARNNIHLVLFVVFHIRSDSHQRFKFLHDCMYMSQVSKAYQILVSLSWSSKISHYRNEISLVWKGLLASLFPNFIKCVEWAKQWHQLGINISPHETTYLSINILPLCFGFCVLTSLCLFIYHISIVHLVVLNTLTLAPQLSRGSPS